jgi:DNA primase
VPVPQREEPSFTVSPTKQFYHCFGCGAHGTAIGFLMEHAGLTFPEAVQELAQSVGLTVPHEPSMRGGAGGGGGDYPAPVSKSVATALSDVMSVACDYYRKQLRGATVAIQYLKEPGPDRRDRRPLRPRLCAGRLAEPRKRVPRLPRRLARRIGLVIVSEKTDAQGAARRYDRFRERIMFPIRNVKGQVIGFGGACSAAASRST